MSSPNRVSPNFDKIPYIPDDEKYVPPLSQVHHFSAVNEDTLPPDPDVDQLNLLPATTQPGYDDYVERPQFWNAENDPLHLFDPDNYNTIAMNPQYDCTKDEILNEIMFEMVGNMANDIKATYDYTNAAKKAMIPSNKKTAGTYNRHMKLLLDYITNEGGVSTTDEKTLINFFTYISNTDGNGYAGNSLWTVYSAINANYQKVTGKKMQRLFNLSKVMRNLTKDHVPVKANTFTKEDLSKIFDGGLLDIDNPLHLESLVGGILSIYGLLRQNELLRITKKLVNKMLRESTAGEDMTCDYPWATKTRKTGFAFRIPARFRYLFEMYLGQLDDSVKDEARFLKNMNIKSKKRSQNLGERKVNQFPKLWGSLLGYDEQFVEGLTSHSFRRTAATILADSGTDMINLKRMGRWSSEKCVEGYIDESMALKNSRMRNLDDTITSNKKHKARAYRNDYHGSSSRTSSSSDDSIDDPREHRRRKKHTKTSSRNRRKHTRSSTHHETHGNSRSNYLPSKFSHVNIDSDDDATYDEKTLYQIHRAVKKAKQDATATANDERINITVQFNNKKRKSRH